VIIGILSFQGDYYLHKRILDNLNVNSLFVNNVHSLNKTDALIIPGGESSVISNFLTKTNLDSEIIRYSLEKNVFGTCAGAIIMSSQCDDKHINTLNIINIKSFRNSWGKQIDSFETRIKLSFNESFINASFIRAPKIKSLSTSVNILSTYKNEPILVRNKKHLASTFHPELNEQSIIHKYFIGMVNE